VLFLFVYIKQYFEITAAPQIKVEENAGIEARNILKMHRLTHNKSKEHLFCEMADKHMKPEDRGEQDPLPNFRNCKKIKLTFEV
jgi:hypothetical protein